MKNEKNIAILKEMAESVRTCMFTTFSSKDEFGSRPMGTAKIEDDGSLWFYTNAYSPKTKEISKENNVLLAYSDPSKNTYLTVKGKAEFVEDKVRKEAYFSPFIKAWFPDGIEDPRLTLIKVTPEEAEYWDASASKIVVLFSLLKAAVTGTTPDLGQHETMKF
ncbi:MULTISPECIES: pyridoxamine 5'-phosphate oxidase family protein [Pedobacter]|uniref:General stress protein n=1 Tax=Pedobacter zeae TaxID=1737356 RepID=A0A7W6K8D9_9SPHI|nr:pyridoxamine 5'-phosphate oxidase family protein [Pedobacter zeae]MBB4107005.1 general stress protein 26 [Pedobacter zeae]GGH05136.1 general stress protein [Pedobacter zeae]